MGSTPTDKTLPSEAFLSLFQSSYRRFDVRSTKLNWNKYGLHITDGNLENM